MSTVKVNTSGRFQITPNRARILCLYSHVSIMHTYPILILNLQYTTQQDVLSCVVRIRMYENYHNRTRTFWRKQIFFLDRKSCEACFSNSLPYTAVLLTTQTKKNIFIIKNFKKKLHKAQNVPLSSFAFIIQNRNQEK